MFCVRRAENAVSKATTTMQAQMAKLEEKIAKLEEEVRRLSALSEQEKALRIRAEGKCEDLRDRVRHLMGRKASRHIPLA